MDADYLICTGHNVLLPGMGYPQPATITVDTLTGKIISIERVHRTPEHDRYKATWIDAGDKMILPGLVDTHVHLNEPGRVDWEGFWTGTRAAASGGITTVVDMPLNSVPPTTSVPNLDEKRNAASGQCFTDVAFWGGVIPGNQNHLKPMIESGVKGFKCFLIDSGVDEFPCVEEHDLNAAMEKLQDTPTVLLFHAELNYSHDEDTATESTANPSLYSTFLNSRPQKFEVEAISLITRLQQLYPSLRCHIVHLSAAAALPLIRAAKSSGAKLTVETCFHYLCLVADDIPNGRPEFKCCPPIRNASNREALWEALRDGTIDCVVSDHSPCNSELKKLDQGDIMSAWGGISTLGLGLSLLWTEGAKRGVTIAQISHWTATKPAEYAGLGNRKGRVDVGYDGDFIIWDPNAEFKVTKDSLNFKNKLSPYEGLTLRGQVKKTILRGRLIYDSEHGFDTSTPTGKLL